jgi:gluconate 5-dehydrogenase
MDSEFKHQHVLITGASRGIGWELARAFLGLGATVTLNGRSEVGLQLAAEKLIADLPTASSRARTIAFDVGDGDRVASACRGISEELPVDVLINCAGVQLREPLVSSSEEDWRRVIDTNLTGAFLVSREVAPTMMRRGRGKILNITSVQSLVVRPTTAAYASAKGGLSTLTKSMCAEWGPHGIQANALAPGYIETEMNRSLVADRDFDRWIVSRTPARRWGTTADLIGPAVWLVSSGANFVNGQTIFADGGLTAVI